MFLGAQFDLVFVMADAAIEPPLALLDGSLDGGNEPCGPEAESFPLGAHRASGQFPVPGIAEDEDVLIGDHFAVCDYAHKADPVQGAVSFYQGLIELKASRSEERRVGKEKES